VTIDGLDFTISPSLSTSLGSYSVSVRVTDDNTAGDSFEQHTGVFFIVEIVETNYPPVFTSVGAGTYTFDNEGGPYTINDFETTDLNTSDTLTYSLSFVSATNGATNCNLLSVVGDTLTLNPTPSETGSYVCNLIVSDNNSVNSILGVLTS